MTETQWRPKKDAPRDGTPIIMWLIYSTGMLVGGRFGEVEVQGKTLPGWFTFDPSAENGFGDMEFEEDEERDFVWIPFPQWEIAEVLGKAIVRAIKDKNEPPSEVGEE